MVTTFGKMSRGGNNDVLTRVNVVLSVVDDMRSNECTFIVKMNFVFFLLINICINHIMTHLTGAFVVSDFTDMLRRLTNCRIIIIIIG